MIHVHHVAVSISDSAFYQITLVLVIIQSINQSELP